MKPCTFHLGDIVSASVFNGNENAQAVGKWRPAVVVRRPGPITIGVAGLTSTYCYRNGKPRVGFSGRAAGLNTNGYLWGGKLVLINTTIDMRSVIGRCYPQMALDIVAVTDPTTLNHDDAQAFLAACRAVEPAPGPDTTYCELCEVNYYRDGDEEHIGCRTVLGIR